MSEGKSDTVIGQADNSDSSDSKNIPLVFMRESALFGDRKPIKSEWVNHSELYSAISNRIESNHITGLQRVRGLWRIYLDNLQDKVTLIEEGIPMRGKIVPVLNTNPQRLDGEDTIRVRVKNIPLSADDGIISRVLTLKGIDIISISREKLRINGKLTNCETGDRLVVVKSTSMKDPLPAFMVFGIFSARVLHAGQTTGNRIDIKCTKCLQGGHRYNQCENDWVCRLCNTSGHKQSDCPSQDTNGTDNTDNIDNTHSMDTGGAGKESDSDTNSDEEYEETTSVKGSSPPPTPSTKVKPYTKDRPSTKDKSSTKDNPTTNLKPEERPKTQLSMDKFISGSSETGTDTPIRKRGNAPERSPPTPVEVLHEKTAKQTKSRKK